MTTKQQMLQSIQQMGEVGADIREALVAELSGYPDDLSSKDLKKFDHFVAKFQEFEFVTGQALTDIADAADDLEEKLVQSEEDHAQQILDTVEDATENAEILTVN